MSASAGPKWSEEDMPSQAGRRALVTGSNSGLGFATARALAQAGASVILACRPDALLAGTAERTAAQAAEDIRARVPEADVDVVEIDLGSQESVRAAVRSVTERVDRLDLLVNNAGIMWQPQGRTEDGFETHMGVNHLGHFTLTAKLLPMLLDQPGSRVVSVSSLQHRQAAFDATDLFYEQRSYGRVKAYSLSKLAVLLFSNELARRLAAADAPTIAVACHPGATASNLIPNAFTKARRLGRAINVLAARSSQTPAMGALPSLYAAVSPNAENGGFYGPDGRGELRGHPTTARASDDAQSQDNAAALWAFSESTTGETFTIPRPSERP